MESIKSIDTFGNIKYKNINGDLHRTDGPALETPTGYKVWCINGVVHREDGPAKIYSRGGCDYFLNDIVYLKEDWETELMKLRLKRLKDL